MNRVRDKIGEHIYINEEMQDRPLIRSLFETTICFAATTWFISYKQVAPNGAGETYCISPIMSHTPLLLLIKYKTILTI